jgi:hypothetical protein
MDSWEDCKLPDQQKPTFINEVFISNIEGSLKVTNNGEDLLGLSIMNIFPHRIRPMLF